MRHHAIVTQRLASWISSGDIIPTIQSSYTTSSNISFIRRFAGVGQSGQSTSQGGQEPPPPPGMFAVVSSMIAGAGGAVLVAGIGCLAVFQMALSVSEHAGKIQKQSPGKDDSTKTE